MNIRMIEKIATEIVKRVAQKIIQRMVNMTSRGLIKLIDVSGKVSVAQVTGYADETLSDVEIFQNWGFRSVPKSNTECIIICPAGARDNAIVIASEDRNNPPPPVKEGESGFYTGENHFIMLRENGKVEIKNKKFEYINVENEWKKEIIGARTFTAFGPMPLIGQDKTFPVILKKQETFLV